MTDGNGCTDSVSTVVTEPAVLVSVMQLDSNVSCYGLSDGGISTNAAGGTSPYSYEWSNGASTSSISGLPGGTYSLTLTDGNGCTTFDNALVSEPDSLVATGVLDSNVSCYEFNNGGASISALGGNTTYSYLWSNGDTLSIADSLLAGTYTVTVSDENGCNDTASVTITEPTELKLSTSLEPVSCFGGADGSITLTATGSVGNYVYSVDSGLTYQSTGTFTGLSSATYDILVKDGNNCMSAQTVIPSQPSALVASVGGVSDVLCKGDASGSAVITSTGGTGSVKYSIDNGVTFKSGGSFTGLGSGNYTVVITDANFCTAGINFTISQPSLALGLTSVVTDVLCKGESTGEIVISESGGTSPYEYSVDGGFSFSASATQNQLGTGTYGLVVRDGNGCTRSKTVKVSSPDRLKVGLTSKLSGSCPGSLDGSLEVSAEGGLGPYSYSIDGNATTQASGLFSGLSSGDYAVSVVDGNGCDASRNLVVNSEGELPVALFDFVKTQTSFSFINLSEGGESYEWSFGDGETSTQKSPTHFYASLPNVLSVELVVSNDCGNDTARISITKEGEVIVGIAARDLSKDVTVYPNPSHGYFVVTNQDLGINKFWSVVVRSIEGKEVYRMDNIGETMHELDLTDEGSGIYIITISSDNQIFNQKLIVE